MMRFLLKCVFDPNYLISLFAEKGGVEAVLELDRSYQIATIPKTLLKKLVFEDLMTLLEKLPKPKTCRDPRRKSLRYELATRAYDIASSYDEYRFLYYFDFTQFEEINSSEIYQPTHICHRANYEMICYAGNFKDAFAALSQTQCPFHYKFDDSEHDKEIIDAVLNRATTSHECVFLAMFLEGKPYGRRTKERALLEARKRIKTASDAILIYDFDKQGRDSALAEQALALEGSSSNFLLLASLLEQGTPLCYQAIEKAKQLMQADPTS